MKGSNSLYSVGHLDAKAHNYLGSYFRMAQLQVPVQPYGTPPPAVDCVILILSLFGPCLCNINITTLCVCCHVCRSDPLGPALRLRNGLLDEKAHTAEELVTVFNQLRAVDLNPYSVMVPTP